MQGQRLRTAIIEGDDGSQPLYVAVGVYAGDRNRFQSSQPAQWTEPSRLIPARSVDADGATTSIT